MSLIIIDGPNFTAFQCSNIEEDYWRYMAEEQEAMRPPEPELPYREFRVRVNRSGRVKNLGMRINKVPATARHF